MRVALIAPVDEMVPPPAYGGTELMVHYLAEQLIHNGHDVQLFGVSGSSTSGRMVPTTAVPVRQLPGCSGPELVSYKAGIAADIVEVLNDTSIDVVHNHFRHLVPLLRQIRRPVVTTVHYPLEVDSRGRMYLDHPTANYIAVSHSQRQQAPGLSFLATVHHGLPVEAYPFEPVPEQYLAFVGRIAPEKGVDIAVRVARKAGMPLKIAAKIEPEHRRYFESEISPLIDGESVEFVGELGQADKRRLLAGARGLLAPVRWSEPFGLALVEAMACGTPVVGSARGAIPEIVVDGETGFIAERPAELARAVTRLEAISRLRCRQHVTDRFAVETMAARYEAVYADVAARR